MLRLSDLLVGGSNFARISIAFLKTSISKSPASKHENGNSSSSVYAYPTISISTVSFCFLLDWCSCSKRRANHKGNNECQEAHVDKAGLLAFG